MFSALFVRVRFLFLLVPRVLAGRCTATRLAAYALELRIVGSRRLGDFCWRQAIDACAHDEEKLQVVLDDFYRSRAFGPASEFASDFFDTNGMDPGVGVKLIGDLVLNGAYEPALETYDRLVQKKGDNANHRSQASPWYAAFDADELRSMLSSRVSENAEGSSASDELELGVARLCFSAGVFDTSGQLYAQSQSNGALDTRDQISQAYSRLSGDQSDQQRPDASGLSTETDPDWLILGASVLFSRGDSIAAAAAVENSLRTRLHEHTDVDPMIADFSDIVAMLVEFPATIEIAADSQGAALREDSARLRKIFVCGNGWTGSGALYDALADYDGLAEMPAAPGDSFLNEGTESEVMFVEGPGGLGHIWRTARQENVVRRSDLWELFRCHVVGAGGVGYVERKCARAASNLLTVAGSRYTGIFRGMFKQMNALGEEASLSRLHSILNTAAESLTEAFAGESDCVLFNNAAFGRNLDMLQIFQNFNAAVVVRDPLDTYADRRAHDLKHWMTPARFVPFYRSSRQATERGLASLTANQAGSVRIVEFERFVREQEYRQSVLDWLLGDGARRVGSRFAPQQSAMNIGMHRKRLSGDECATIDREIGHWRRN